MGRAGDRIGQRKVLLICIVGMAALYIPLAFVKTVPQLIMFYAALGLFLGGTMPTANALLARSTPTERRGAVFGISNSFQAAGRSLGPMIGAGIANRWGISSVFLATSGLLCRHRRSHRIGAQQDRQRGCQSGRCPEKR